MSKPLPVLLLLLITLFSPAEPLLQTLPPLTYISCKCYSGMWMVLEVHRWVLILSIGC